MKIRNRQADKHLRGATKVAKNQVPENQTAKNTAPATKAGFTLTETALATALIAVLLIAVAVIIMNIVSIYRKGMTLKTMNSVGRTLVEDFDTTIAASTPTEITTGTAVTNSAQGFDAYYRNYAAATDSETARGAFCPGTYSYLWQTYADDAHVNTLTFRFTSSSGAVSEYTDFRLLKIRDPAQAVCKGLNEDTRVLDLTPSDDDEGDAYVITQAPEEMLADTDIDLVVYDLTVAPVDSAQNLNQDIDTLSTAIFFSGTITLGTLTDLENTENGQTNTLRLDTEACDVGRIDGGLDGGVTDFDYCAVNRFKFAARAGSSDV